MSKGRVKSDGLGFQDTLAKNSAEQGTLIKQDELIDKLNGQVIKAIDAGATSGGSATASLTVTGLRSDDTILVASQITAGGGTGKQIVEWANQADNSLDVTWDADPGAGAVVRVVVLRSVSESDGDGVEKQSIV